MPYASRLDSTQSEVIAALRAAGFTVIPMNRMRGQFLDLLVAKQGVTIAVEVKADGGTFTDMEKKFFSDWPGECTYAFTPEQAITNCNWILNKWQRKE